MRHRNNNIMPGIVIAVAVALLPWAVPGHAHSPIFTCFANGDGSVTCEGAFSDGSSAAGAAVEVRDGKGRVLTRKTLDFTGTVELERPATKDFVIIFDGGPNHTIEVRPGDIRP
ncbi:MAG: hypothetical protein JW781_01085 [Deltaproteobacteria bacterium]|nr:hypothetical protein [Candidatus Anaeroferrophillacea bacterium]